MEHTQSFTARVHNKEVLELYFGLTAEEKELLNNFGAQYLLTDIAFNDFYPKNICHYLWVSAANIIPQGNYCLAEKLLLLALNHTVSSEDLGHIHANLAQIYEDQGRVDKCRQHCTLTLETGFFTKWAQETLTNLK